MPINGIQMQKGLSLPEFIQLYGTEQQCEAALQKVRWPQGFHVMDKMPAHLYEAKRIYGIVVIVRIKPV